MGVVVIGKVAVTSFCITITLINSDKLNGILDGFQSIIIDKFCNLGVHTREIDDENWEFFCTIILISAGENYK